MDAVEGADPTLVAGTGTRTGTGTGTGTGTVASTTNGINLETGQGIATGQGTATGRRKGIDRRRGIGRKAGTSARLDSTVWPNFRSRSKSKDREKKERHEWGSWLCTSFDGSGSRDAPINFREEILKRQAEAAASKVVETSCLAWVVKLVSGRRLCTSPHELQELAILDKFQKVGTTH